MLSRSDVLTAEQSAPPFSLMGFDLLIKRRVHIIHVLFVQFVLRDLQSFAEVINLSKWLYPLQCKGRRNLRI